MNKLKKIIKVAAFDVDGTILPNGKTKFSKEIVEMFAKLRENKIISVISTAREFATINTILDQLNPDYFIGANGAFIYDFQNKKIIYEKTMKKDEVKAICDNFKTKKNNYIISALNNCFYSEGANLDTWFIRPNIANYYPVDFDKVNSEHIHILTMATDDVTLVGDQIQKFIDKNNFDLEINSKWSRGLFISPKNITKSHTLDILLKSLNLSHDNLIAFGDSSNDFEMLRDAFYGVAMERASEKIKSVANDIALDCEYNGAYLKLKELKLI